MILCLTSMTEIIILQYTIFPENKAAQLVPFILLSLFFCFYKVKLLSKKRKTLIHILFDILTIISLMVLFVFLCILVKNQVKDEKFKYNDLAYYCFITFNCGNCLSFGEHYLDLLFKPIEKEFFSSKLKPIKHCKNSSLRSTAPSKSNASLEPFIPSIINKTYS